MSLNHSLLYNNHTINKITAHQETNGLCHDQPDQGSTPWRGDHTEYLMTAGLSTSCYFRLTNSDQFFHKVYYRLRHNAV